MDVNHINPFLESTISVFESMLGVTPQAGSPALMNTFHTHRWDISGVIGIVGAADGVIALRMTDAMVTQFLESSGVTCDSDEERNTIINSMVGEIINVIAGNTLGRISEYDLKITVPLVIQGRNHSIAWPQNTPIITIPFRTPKGLFEVTVSLKENRLYQGSCD